MSKPEKYSFYCSTLQSAKFGVSRFLFYARTHGYPKLIDDYTCHPEKYVRSFSVTINGKKRQIVTYQPNTFGAKLRNIHRQFALVLKELYTSSEYSYAYKTGRSVKSCLERHMTNDFFLKSDIHAYFDSISFETLMEKLCGYSKTFSSKQSYWTHILQSCFYQGHMPIGFVSSPILSDLYLCDMDNRMGKMDGIVYTRYADDFIISATGENVQKKLDSALEVLQNEMDAHGLELNHKKTYFRQLRQEGDAIHMLGLNMVRTAEGFNRLTVSDRYIRETCKELCNLMQDKPYLEDWEARKRFCAAMGKVAYIVHASEQSAQKLKKMILVKSGHDLSLDYQSLAALCLNRPESIIEYQNKQHTAAYIKALSFRILPSSGTCMERLSIRGATDQERNMADPREQTSCFYAAMTKKDTDTMDEIRQIWKSEAYKEANNRRYTLGSLKYYVMNLCRALENTEEYRLDLHRIRLTIGDETIVISSRAEASLLHAFAKKLRNTNEAVQFFAEYDYANPDNGKTIKCGTVYMQPTGWRPLLGYAGNTNADCVIYSQSRDYWLMRDHAGHQDEYTLASTDSSAIEEHPYWWVSFGLKASWPLHTPAVQQQELRHIAETFYALAGVSLPQKFGRTIFIDREITANIPDILLLEQNIKKVLSLLKEADGTFDLNCWMIPADYFDAHDERPLDLVQLYAQKDGRVQILKGSY